MSDHSALKNKISNSVTKKSLAEADPRAGTAPLKYHICETTDNSYTIANTQYQRGGREWLRHW